MSLLFLSQSYFAARDAHGLFHIAGNFARVREYINTLNAGQELNFDAKTSPHDVAQLLKQYLKQLPEPIIPFSSYELFLEARSGNRRLSRALTASEDSD